MRCNLDFTAHNFHYPHLVRFTNNTCHLQSKQNSFWLDSAQIHKYLHQLMGPSPCVSSYHFDGKQQNLCVGFYYRSVNLTKQGIVDDIFLDFLYRNFMQNSKMTFLAAIVCALLIIKFRDHVYAKSTIRRKGDGTFLLFWIEVQY